MSETITPTAVPNAGYNLTDSADFTALAPGEGNGVQFSYDNDDLVLLKNETGGDAIYTLVVGEKPAGYATSAVVVTDPTITVEDGKTVALKLDTIFKQPSGKVLIDCDVAGEILILDL